jgi:hypothetical protein
MITKIHKKGKKEQEKMIASFPKTKLPLSLGFVALKQ